MLKTTIDYGQIFYHSNRRRQTVEFTLSLRQATEQAIHAAHTAVNYPIPKPIDHKNKCRDCSLKSICLPSEIKKLVNSQVS